MGILLLFYAVVLFSVLPMLYRPNGRLDYSAALRWIAEEPPVREPAEPPDADPEDTPSTALRLSA